jgi:hypothetical protein
MSMNTENIDKFTIAGKKFSEESERGNILKMINSLQLTSFLITKD